MTTPIHTIGRWRLILHTGPESAYYAVVGPDGTEYSLESLQSIYEGDEGWPHGLTLNTLERLDEAAMRHDIGFHN